MSKTKLPNKQSSSTNSSYWAWGAILIIILLTVALRIRLLEIPLSRDEGGYAYTAQLILQGIPPFAKTYDMKMPGLYYVYALILSIFGQTTVGIHLGLLVISAATAILVFLLGRRLFDSTTGIIAGASYAIMSVSQTVVGFLANAEQLLLLPALGGILLMLRAIDSRRLRSFFGSGLLLGLASVIKHQGTFFVGFAGLYLFLSYFKKPRNLWACYVLEYALFGLGIIIPFGLLCLQSMHAGLFDKFWFWLFEYTREYASIAPFPVGLSEFANQVSRMAQTSILLWILAGIGLISLLCNKKLRTRSPFIGGLFLFSFLSVWPGFYFFNHYFVLPLPALAILVGVGVSATAGFLTDYKSFIIRKGVPILLAGGAILYSVFAERAYLFELSPNAISRMIHGSNPFIESIEIADYIKRHTSADDSIAILGSEPQICFYARRHSASAHIYVYPLMGEHDLAIKMQQEMIQEIETARPEFLVLVNVLTSWLRQPDSEEMIFDWFQQYHQKYYRLVGVIEIISQQRTIYRWGQECEKYKPRSKRWLLVFKRKNDV